MFRRSFSVLVPIAVAVVLASCSPKIYGTVQLVDTNMKPLENESYDGTVVNMINTTAKVENASTSVNVDQEGEFESPEESIVPGTYKVEAARIGFETETETVEIGGSTRKKLAFTLKKIEEGKRRLIEGSTSDADKIINPGEVNIRPPEM